MVTTKITVESLKISKNLTRIIPKINKFFRIFDHKFVKEKAVCLDLLLTSAVWNIKWIIETNKINQT